MAVLDQLASMSPTSTGSARARFCGGSHPPSMTTIAPLRPRQPRLQDNLHRVAGSELSPTEERVRAKVEAHVRAQFGGDNERAFRATDANGDGQVDKKELTGLLANAGVAAPGLVAGPVIDRFDTDRSKGISWSEFQGGLR